MLEANLDHIDQETPDIWTFWFATEKPLDYIAGQYTELYLPHDGEDDRGHKRWFTLSSSPSDKLISITTKRARENGSSFKDKLFSLEPGSRVKLAEAMGDFVLPKDTSIPLVFVAGGIGITPFHSIFKYLSDSGEQRDIKFIYGVNSEDEIVFEESWKKIGVNTTIVVSNPSDEWGGQTGRISSELIMSLGQPGSKTLVYVSGPEPMTEALEKNLKTSGLKSDQLVLDFFPGYENSYSN